MMEQIQAQASDLHSLAGASSPPIIETIFIPSTPDENEQPHCSTEYRTESRYPDAESSSSQGANAQTHGKKKSPKRTGGSKSGSIRKKRSQYTALVCECRRRKIKCNGESPCQRCSSRNLPCLYNADRQFELARQSNALRQVTGQVTQLQDEIGRLRQIVKDVQLEPVARTIPNNITTATTASSNAYLTPEIVPSVEHGSPSGLNRVYSISEGSEISDAFSNPPAGEFPDVHDHHSPTLGAQMTQGHLDALCRIDNAEMVHLCSLFDEALGFAYPVLDMESIIANAETRPPIPQQLNDEGCETFLESIETLQLKLVMCCALAIAGEQEGTKAAQIYNSIRDHTSHSVEHEGCDLSYLAFLVLSTGYHLLCRQRLLAAQVTWKLARLCLRMNLHQITGLVNIADEEKRKYALNIFWAAYVLDQQAAHDTGLPRIIRDDDIDAQLTLPVAYPYLAAMVTWSKMSSEVQRRWRTWPQSDWAVDQHFLPPIVGELDNQALQWYGTLPEELKLVNMDKEKTASASQTDINKRPRIWTCCRLLQLRIRLYAPVLRSRASVAANPELSRQAVALAKDTIRYLTSLQNMSCDESVQVFYPEFLLSVVGILFLASAYGPSEYIATCQDGFYDALCLARPFMAKIWFSQRLTKLVQSLKNVAPRFGIQLDMTEPCSMSSPVGLTSDQGILNGSEQPQSTYRLFNVTLNVSRSDTEFDGVPIWIGLSRMFEAYTRMSGLQRDDDDTLFLLVQDLI